MNGWQSHPASPTILEPHKPLAEKKQSKYPRHRWKPTGHPFVVYLYAKKGKSTQYARPNTATRVHRIRNPSCKNIAPPLPAARMLLDVAGTRNTNKCRTTECSPERPAGRVACMAWQHPKRRETGRVFVHKMTQQPPPPSRPLPSRPWDLPFAVSSSSIISGGRTDMWTTLGLSWLNWYSAQAVNYFRVLLSTLRLGGR